MITTAPLPPLSHLLGLGRPLHPLLAPWQETANQAWWLSRSCWSLAILARALGHRLGRPPRVALPAWICGQSLMPLRATGAVLEFLPVDQNGLAQWSAADHPDMVVAVHTFGHPVPLAEAATAAPFLVEDCAHALVPGCGMGEVGDAAIFSPHKVLGLSEGAVLTLTPKAGNDVTTSVENLLAALPPTASDNRWRIKRLIQTMIPDRLRRRLPPVGQPAHDRDPEGGDPPPLRAPSPLAAQLTQKANIEREATRRRANALALRHALGGMDGVTPFFREDGPAPYRFVLQVRDPAHAAHLYHRLREARLPVESWPDLPPEVMATPSRFGCALNLRRRLLLLPVHGALAPCYATLYAEALHGA